MKRTTYHDGATDERQCLRRKLQRIINETQDDKALIILFTFLEWITKRHERYTKRHGGL